MKLEEKIMKILKKVRKIVEKQKSSEELKDVVEDNRLYCRIWAIELDPRDGSAHYCHAKSKGLKGGLYPKDIIDRVLEEKSTNLETMRWYLVGCKPSHDGSACETCKYKIYKNSKWIEELEAT